MALSQVEVFGTQGAIPFAALGQSCVDAPALTTVGSNSYLAYFDTSNHFNLAIDQKGGVNFDFTNRFTSTTTESTYAPALVSLVGGTLGYVFWSNSTGVNYAQIGLVGDDGHPVQLHLRLQRRDREQQPDRRPLRAVRDRA